MSEAICSEHPWRGKQGCMTDICLVSEAASCVDSLDPVDHCHSVGSQGSRNNPPEKRKSALDILKERYVRDEIDQQEFEHKRKELED
jgi:hypothetical protein